MKGIIFDLDGVIVSTDRYHYLGWKALADRLGIYFDETINNRLRGVSRMASLDIILERYEGRATEQEKAAWAAEKNAVYVKLLDKLSSADLLPGVRETLEELKTRGLKLAVGSSSKNTRLILGKIGLADFFDAVSDGNNIARSKPDPEVFLKAAQFLGLEPADCLVVEDACAGIEAACAGGFPSAAVGDAFGYERATYSLSDFRELLELAGR